MTDRQLTDQILGREAELSSLGGFLDAFAEGPAAVVLRGEPGVGKTTLWRAALERAGRQGCRVLSAVPLEFEARLSFTVLGDLLSGVLTEVLPVLPVPQQRALEVALAREEQDEGFVADQRTISTAFLGAIRHLSEQSPTLLAIDDLQWVDPPSAHVVQFALHRLGDEPIRLLATARAGLGSSDPLQLRRVLPQGRLTVSSVEGLKIREIDLLLRARVDATFPHTVLNNLYRISGGNPLFAIEIGQVLARRSAPVSLYEPLPVPEDLRELVAVHLSALPDPVKQTLLVVAALSQTTMGMITSIVGVQGAHQVWAAVDAGVVEVEGDLVRFAHPILGSTLYARASAEQKRAIHRSIAEVLADPEERALHLALSTSGPDADVAAALDEAGHRARSRGAQDAAAELLEVSGRLTPRNQQDQIRQRVMHAAHYRFEAGDTSRARSLLEGVVATMPPGSERAEALRLLGTIRWYDSRADSVALLTTALEESGADDALRASIQRELAWTMLLSGDARTAEGHALAAVEVAERLEDPSLLADSLTALAFIEAWQAKGDPLARARRAEQLAGRTESVRLFRHPGMMYGIALKWADRFEEARTQLESMRTDAIDRGDESSLPYVLYHLSELECWAGDWQRAADYANQSYDLAVWTSQEAVRAASLYAKALVDARRGRADEARAEAEEGAALAERTESPLRVLQNLHVLGFLELSLGRYDLAAPRLVQVEELASNIGLAEPGALRFMADEVEAFVGLGELGRARAVLASLDDRGETLGREWTLATAGRCHALVAAADGDLSAALDAVEEALERHQRLDDPFELARTLVVAGGIRRRLKQKLPARQALERAAAEFERLGAELWSKRARDELARIAGRRAGPPGLTPTERQIAELVAQGRSSKEVAEAMFMSIRTVESNLTRIYQKLGVRSRTQMAAKLRGEEAERTPDG